MIEQLIGMKLMDLWNADVTTPTPAGLAGMGRETVIGYSFIITYEGEEYEVTIKNVKSR